MSILNLSSKEKIDILENIDWDSMQRKGIGLCWAINQSSINLYPMDIDYIESMDTNNIIDLCTWENAKGFSSYDNNYYKSAFWFPNNKQGYEERRAFVMWMIRKYVVQSVKVINH